MYIKSIFLKINKFFFCILGSLILQTFSWKAHALSGIDLYSQKKLFVNGPKAEGHRQAKQAFLNEDFKQARGLWLSIANDYEKEGRLQEAAWTYRQAGEDSRAELLIQQIEAQLYTEDIVEEKPIGIGISGALKVRLRSGLWAIWKTQYYEGEAMNSRLDRKIKADFVPITIERDHKGVHGSLQLWIDHAQMLVAFQEDIKLIPNDMRFFDAASDNTGDRKGSNALIREGDYIVGIDHGFAIRFLNRRLSEASFDSVEIVRNFLNLTDADLREVLGNRFIENFSEVKASFEEVKKLLTARLATIELENSSFSRFRISSCHAIFL